MGPPICVEHTAWTQWVPRLLVCYIFKGRSRISNTIFSSVKTWHLKYVHNFKSGGPSPLTKHQKALCLGISWFMCLYFALWSEFHIYSFFSSCCGDGDDGSIFYLALNLLYYNIIPLSVPFWCTPFIGVLIFCIKSPFHRINQMIFKFIH